MDKSSLTGICYQNFSRIEVNLDHIISNYLSACSFVGKATTVTCVLKGNAYGHGAQPVALALQEAGCNSFAVSSAREALSLRLCGILGEIIVMGISEECYLQLLAKNSITITLASTRQATSIRQPMSVQIKIDTGLHRLGFTSDDVGIEEIIRAVKQPNIHVAGIYTHLGLVNKNRDNIQHTRFLNAVCFLADRGICTDDIHICDSIAMLRYPQYHHSRVRIGAFLFGVLPFLSNQTSVDCKETLRFISCLTRVEYVKKGEYIGYDDEAPLYKDRIIGTVQVGYADGYPRRLAKKAWVIIRGKRAAVISRICMDQMMVDITDITDASVGDEVILLGNGITYDEYAAWANSNRNEMLACLSQRPQRNYIRNGQYIFTDDAFFPN